VKIGMFGGMKLRVVSLFKWHITNYIDETTLNPLIFKGFFI